MDLLEKARTFQGSCIWNPNGTHNGTSTLVGLPEQQTRPDQLRLADRLGWELPLVFVPEFWVMGSIVLDTFVVWPGEAVSKSWSWVLTSPAHHLTRFTSEFDLGMEGLVNGLDSPQEFVMCNLVEPV